MYHKRYVFNPSILCVIERTLSDPFSCWLSYSALTLFRENQYKCIFFMTDCGDFTLENGTVTVPTGTTYGEIAFLSCESDFVIVGESYVVCQADGNWSSTSTNCLRGKLCICL